MLYGSYETLYGTRYYWLGAMNTDWTLRCNQLFVRRPVTSPVPLKPASWLLSGTTQRALARSLVQYCSTSQQRSKRDMFGSRSRTAWLPEPLSSTRPSLASISIPSQSCHAFKAAASATHSFSLPNGKRFEEATSQSTSSRTPR